jgi:multicomponent Na+:H+ antiporter subunit C
MIVLLAGLVGVLVTCGVYLILRRTLLRVLFGIVLLSNAVNLALLTVGRVLRAAPPILPEGATAPVVAAANPLPQALVLTAIVIGFGLVAFALVLVYRVYWTFDTIDTDDLAARS